MLSAPRNLLPCVLFVDDEPTNRMTFRAAFRRQFRVLLAGTPEEAFDHLNSSEVDVVISDQRMPGTVGSEFLAQVRQRFPKVRRMLVTAYSDLQALVDAVNRAGVSQYIQKPWDAGQLAEAVRQAHQDRVREVEQDAQVTYLAELNQQLEFALRQRLLS
ncbi:MAG: response regulator [Flavobacteriales bacterium]|nr:response regulator [Flavobacteriales bacterium]